MKPKGLFTYGAAVLLAALLTASVFTPADALAATAKENYAFYCAQCHGLEGRGNGPNATRNQPVDPRDHTSPVEMRKITDDDVIEAISKGGTATAKSGLMPPFGNTLTEEEIVALKDYIRGLCNCKAGE